MNATTNHFRSRISAKRTCLWLRQESSWKMTVGRVLVDYIRVKQYAPKTANIFCALPLYDQHTAMSVCPSSSCETSIIWRSVALYVIPYGIMTSILIQKALSWGVCLHYVSFAQHSFVQRERMHVCQRWNISDKLPLANEEEKRQGVFGFSKKPQHINSSVVCTGNSGVIPKNQWLQNLNI